MRWLVLFMLVSALAGCTDAEPEPASTSTTDSSTPTGSSTGSSSTSTTAPAPTTWNLDIADNSFPGGSIEIQVGDTVRWTHAGSNPHSVTADDGSFDSGSATPADWMRAGDVFEFTFDAAGSFPYHCDVHPSMTGTITVTA